MSSHGSVSDGTWSDEDIESFLMTIGVLVVTSIISWYCVIRPAVRRKTEMAPTDAAPADAASRTRRPMHQNAGTPRHRQRPNRNFNTDDNEDGILAMLRRKTRVPPHYYLSTTSSMPQVQHDGIVPFRQTKASTYDSSLATTNEDLLFQHRKDRARIFTRLFQTSPPPPRGSCMVLAIHASSSCTNPKTCRVIMLLASYYNLFLLLQMNDNEENDNNKEKQESYISQLREVIPSNILPTHRIIPTGSSVGRIAFCRQLPKQPELVLDFEELVKTQLTRFGFQVTICNNIGQELIP